MNKKIWVIGVLLLISGFSLVADEPHFKERFGYAVSYNLDSESFAPFIGLTGYTVFEDTNEFNLGHLGFSEKNGVPIGEFSLARGKEMGLISPYLGFGLGMWVDSSDDDESSVGVFLDMYLGLKIIDWGPILMTLEQSIAIGLEAPNLNESRIKVICLLTDYPFFIFF